MGVFFTDREMTFKLRSRAGRCLVGPSCGGHVVVSPVPRTELGSVEIRAIWTCPFDTEFCCVVTALSFGKQIQSEMVSFTEWGFLGYN